MKLECILLREGGTLAEIGGKAYHFAPQSDGRHVAEVTIEAHIERFLSIPEAYRIYRTKADSDTAAVLVPADDNPPAVEVDPAELLGSKSHPATFVINDQAYTLEDITLHAFQDSGLTVEDWNGLDDETRAMKIDLVLDGIESGEITVETADGADQDGNDDREELKAMYLARFGKDAGRMRTNKIKEALEL